MALGPKQGPDVVVRPEDIQDTSKLAKILERLLSNVATLKALWYPRRIDFEDVDVGSDGAVVRLSHGFRDRVRWSVIGWRENASPITDIRLGTRLLWIQRAMWGAPTFNNGVVNATTGCRFQVTTACSIMGARFLWKAVARTVKATLWRDSDGAILGSGTVACVNSGVYTVAFDSPVALAGANLNVDLTVGIYDMSGTVYTASGLDAAFSGYLPLTLPGLVLKSIKLHSNATGDNRPTTSSAVELFWVEPVLTPATPQLIEDSTTTADVLALRSYVPGTATIRVEAAG